MTIEQMIEALRQYPGSAILKCGLSVPDMYINTVANLSISGDHADVKQCTSVRLVVTAPPREALNNANPNPSGPVPAS